MHDFENKLRQEIADLAFESYKSKDQTAVLLFILNVLLDIRTSLRNIEQDRSPKWGSKL